MSGHVVLNVVLTEEQAEALAVHSTRVSLQDFRTKATDEDEAHRMYSATLFLGIAIEQARLNPPHSSIRRNDG